MLRDNGHMRIPREIYQCSGGKTAIAETVGNIRRDLATRSAPQLETLSH